MTYANIKPAVDYLQQVKAGYVQSPRKFQAAMNREMRSIRSDIERVLLSENPPQSPTPYKWSPDPAANTRARRWWFANHVSKNGGGGRYERTGALIKAWEITGTFVKSSGAIKIENKARGARYVFMKGRQNPSHVRTGWKTSDARKREFAPMITRRYQAVWMRSGNPLAKGS